MYLCAVQHRARESVLSCLIAGLLVQFQVQSVPKYSWTGYWYWWQESTLHSAALLGVYVCIHERIANTLRLLVKLQVKGAVAFLWACRGQLQKTHGAFRKTPSANTEYIPAYCWDDLKSTLSVRADTLSVLFIWKRPTLPKTPKNNKKNPNVF